MTVIERPEVVTRPLSAQVRRRRALVVLVMLLAVLGGSALLAGRANAAGESGKVVTVAPGQTLSEIAAREVPGEPVRAAVTDIQLANNLPTSHIEAGQRLVIPAR